MENNRFRQGFSVAGLVYGPVYYYAMRDWLYFWLSIAASLFVFTAPLLLVLAVFARRRAWAFQIAPDSASFERTQQQWDRSALYAFALVAIILYFTMSYVYSSLENTFGTTDPQQILQQVNDLSGQ